MKRLKRSCKDRMRIHCGGRGQVSQYDDKGTLLINKGIDTRGGIYFFTGQSGIWIRREIFAFNRVSKDGGAVFFYNCQDILVEDCIFICNSAKWGGAMYFEKCRDIVLRNNKFILNLAIRDGGAVSFSHSSNIRVLDGNIYLGNKAFRSSSDIEFHYSQCADKQAEKSLDHRLSFRK